jgi:hypothetical protein
MRYHDKCTQGAIRGVRQLLGKEALAKFELCTAAQLQNLWNYEIAPLRALNKEADSTERLSRLHIRGGTPPVCLVMQGEKLV